MKSLIFSLVKIIARLQNHFYNSKNQEKTIADYFKTKVLDATQWLSTENSKIANRISSACWDCICKFCQKRLKQEGRFHTIWKIPFR